VLRRTSLGGNARLENSAEHSWHIAMMVPVLAEHAPWPVDPLRVVRMLLVHDVVEIDAGDTFAFDAAAHHDKEEREQAAADRLFGLLPDDQAAELHDLWNEFEAAQSDDARFAQALDRLGGVLQNALNDGGTWIEHGVSREAVLRRQEPIRDALPDLWPWVVELTDRVLG
jgi:putative hydrolase of HD superfamily